MPYTDNTVEQFINDYFGTEAAEQPKPPYTFKRLGALETALLPELRAEYARVIEQAYSIVRQGVLVAQSRSAFIEFTETPANASGIYTHLCLAMLDGEGEDIRHYGWRLVQNNVEEVLDELFNDESGEVSDKL